MAEGPLDPDCFDGNPFDGNSFDDARFDDARFDDALLDRWRTLLREAAFDEAFVGRCEAVAPRMLDAVRLPVVRWWLRQQSEPAAVVARLWAYDDEVDEDTVDRVFEPGLRAALVEAGALRPGAHGWRGGLRLMPFAGLWIASEPMHGEDPVMGPGATTQELARAIGDAPGRVLDIGCGAGSLALVAAARGATEVTGVDLHPRAAAWGRLNARLNEQSIELLTGDLTAPVKGRTFDLVLAQPPFVIKPPDVDATTYLHGGAMGDELTMRLLAELPPLLHPGAQAILLFDSPVRPELPLWRRTSDAHDDDELQQLLFVSPGNGPDLQAIGYAANSHPSLGPRYAQAVERYRRHLDTQAIEHCEHALVVLRRQTPGMSVTIERPSLAGVDAAIIARSWDAIAVASAPPETLLTTRVAVPEGAWLVQEQALDGHDGRLRLRLPPERGGDQVLSDAAALLVDQLRSPVTVAELVERYAAASELSVEQVQGGVLDFVRQSLVVGRLDVAEAR